MMSKFRKLQLGTNDLVQIRNMVELAHEGVSSSAKLKDSQVECKVYSMGENNPIIRIDIKRSKEI